MTVGAIDHQNRRVMSMSSWFGGSSSATVRGSSAMPQIGQTPGSSRTTSGCMGQTYSTLVASTGTAGSSAMPQSGQLPGAGERTSGCMGQVKTVPVAGWGANRGVSGGASAGTDSGRR